MSATRRLPQITALLGGVALSLAAMAKPTLRFNAGSVLGVNVPGGTWRLLALVLALVNLKNWPFVWHYRLFKSLIYHLFIQPTTLTPSSLFSPLITTSHTPIAETDYNFHKSNSTYFTDLDISRTHLVTALLKQGIRGEKRREAMTEEEWFAAATEPGNLLIALGAVSCHFHREIAPYRRYEIWTRLLTWDRKWLYIVSHFVEAGAFVPEGYALQPWKKVRGKWEDLSESDRKALERKVFASSIAKYVVKKGRLTVPPEMALERAMMLPPRPTGTKVDGESAENADGDGESPSKMVLEESLFAEDVKGDYWTWERVQEERKNGLKLAEAYDSLEGLKGVFAGGEGVAMGQYDDLIFGW
ncbi:hypothetical protein EJ08DRAFT_598624 [Tothia fuscella]|uniref:Capsule polysaccharide biosynthesis protein n=1 Tax=Tothia fuscella TaxID=1048955 RepID=A0A9P4NFT9_9PEZI|nr:hypothetical protein EJ08DRAFT_598624 [Tothia fuscella]